MAVLNWKTFRRESHRLTGYDYSSPGKYFITICTKKMICYLGEIKNGEVILSEAGKIAQKFWLEIPTHFPETDLDEFVIMPNHIHGIIIIRKVDGRINKQYTIGVIINQFKRISTIGSKTNGIKLIWQPRYHDHIIRNRLDLYRVRKYIQNNTKKYAK